MVGRKFSSATTMCFANRQYLGTRALSSSSQRAAIGGIASHCDPTYLTPSPTHQKKMGSKARTPLESKTPPPPPWLEGSPACAGRGSLRADPCHPPKHHDPRVRPSAYPYRTSTGRTGRTGEARPSPGATSRTTNCRQNNTSSYSITPSASSDYHRLGLSSTDPACGPVLPGRTNLPRI